MMRAKILLVDDHEVVRQGARAILQKARPDWDICGEASTGVEAIGAVERLRPDLVVLDISMPRMTGIEATPLIAKADPNCKILLFTMHESDALLAEAKQLGAHGYVQKTLAGRDLVQAVDRLLSGGTFFGPRNSPDSPPAAENNPGGGISYRARATHAILMSTMESVCRGTESRVRAGNFVSKREDLTDGAMGRRAQLLILKYLVRAYCGFRFAGLALGKISSFKEAVHGNPATAGC